MNQESQLTWSSRSWLAITTLIAFVLMSTMVVGTGLSLTVGAPQKLAPVAQSYAKQTGVAKQLNQALSGAVKKADTQAELKQPLVTQPEVDALVTSILLAADRTTPQVSLTTLSQAVKARVTTKQPKVVQAAIDKQLNQSVRVEIEMQGFGGAYTIISLMVKVLAIVSGILLLIMLVFVAKSAHGWLRFLKALAMVSITTAGMLTLGLGSFTLLMALGGLPAWQPLWPQVASTLAPTWWLVIAGTWLLGIALASFTMAIRPKRA